MDTNHNNPRPVLPLVALLALASALGVAVAVALAGVAMLLAAPAYAHDERCTSPHGMVELELAVLTLLDGEPVTTALRVDVADCARRARRVSA